MLELTRDDGHIIWVNLNRALYFHQCVVNGKQKTLIDFGGGDTLFVKETPKSIGERLLKILIFSGK